MTLEAAESVFTRRMMADLEATIDRTLYSSLTDVTEPDTLLLPPSTYKLLVENRMKKSKKKARKTKAKRGYTLTFATDEVMPDIASSRFDQPQCRSTWRVLDPAAPDAIEIASSVRHGARPKKGEARVLATALIEERAKALRLEHDLTAARGSKRDRIVGTLANIASGCDGPSIAEQLRAVELLIELQKNGWLVR